MSEDEKIVELRKIDQNYLAYKIKTSAPAEFRIKSGQFLRNNVPGAKWNAEKFSWIVPLQRVSVVNLRKMFDIHPVPGGNHLISPYPSDFLSQLTVIADNGAPDVFLSKDGKAAETNIIGWDKLDKIIEANGGKGSAVPISKLNDYLMMLSSQLPEVIVDEEIKKISRNSEENSALCNKKQLYLYDLDDLSIEILKSVTPSVKKKLNSIGVTTIKDLITFYPLKYIDRSKPVDFNNIQVGDEVAVNGTIKSVKVNYTGRRYVKYIIEDASKQRVAATFFNQQWIAKRFKEGMKVVVYGKYSEWVSKGKGTKTKQIENPKIDFLDTAKGNLAIVPIYNQFPSLKLTSTALTKIILELANRLKTNHILMEEIGVELNNSLIDIHTPSSNKQLISAIDNLVEHELLYLQLFIQTTKETLKAKQGISMTPGDKGELNKYIKKLPYKLTAGQQAAKEEILEDMSSNKPMHRLLQGDVGSGKTTIAALASLNAIDNGGQVALVAPTEILARQLYYELDKILTNSSTEVEFLGGKQTVKERQKINNEISSGEINIVVGTHAILQDTVNFNNLALVIIDEQHRFGVEQRTSLIYSREDNRIPDVLFMTATPIPRTSAMVIYGDMDITFIKDLPPGRKQIITQIENINPEKLMSKVKSKIWQEINDELSQGRQVYVVASLIEDGDNENLVSVERAAEMVKEIFPNYVVSSVHGKVPPKERNAVIEEFNKGNINILIATTVIEVGINVPNATSMVILNAERFGISQLHQLRGRVGRADLQSRCYLVSEVINPVSAKRLSALAESNDGFYLADRDLEIRGEGKVFGNEQSGVSDLKIASIKDIEKIKSAQHKIHAILGEEKLTDSMIRNMDNIFNHNKIKS